VKQIPQDARSGLVRARLVLVVVLGLTLLSVVWGFGTLVFATGGRNVVEVSPSSAFDSGQLRWFAPSDDHAVEPLAPRWGKEYVPALEGMSVESELFWGSGELER
jgi:hypothetical protein